MAARLRRRPGCDRGPRPGVLVGGDGWPVGRPWSGRPEFTSLEPADGTAYAHVQVIDGPPRVHLDLAVDDLDAHRDRRVELGATAGLRTDAWQVMASPGGLPFCRCSEPWPRRRPGALARRAPQPADPGVHRRPGRARRRGVALLAAGDRDAAVRRLAGLGARAVGEGSGWVVLRDPAGLPFCVTVQNRELAGPPG